ncbi:MAG: hypothetical protein J7L89_02070, partial [Bacteroidales bacterium]|nr:hypothetical protein [Bacteroidales bacterium]
MGTLKTIFTIARFEAMLLFRSWFFRIFVILLLFWLLPFNISSLTQSWSNWILLAMPSNIPYLNIMVLNVAQTFIAIFLAIDFLRRDKKLDTTEVIYTRSMNNWDYIWGKTIGVLLVFLVLHLLVLTMVVTINFAVPGTHVDIMAYLYYPLLISLPSLLFIMGLAFLVMSLVRNQAIALVVLLGYVGLVLFAAKDRMDFLYDFIGMRLPFMRSELSGFGFEPVLLQQRALYLFLGLAMILGSILLMKRLPQSRSRTVLAWIFLVLFGISGITLAVKYALRDISDRSFREEMVKLNDKYAKHPHLKLIAENLKVHHMADSLRIEAESKLTSLSGTPVKRLVFTLNPGLKLNEIKVNHTAQTFKRQDQIVLIDLKEPLVRNDTLRVLFSISGTIDERICYLDVAPDQLREKYSPNFGLSVRKRFSFVQKDFLLLTPESYWYPVPGVAFGSAMEVKPDWNFSYYTVSLQTDNNLIPVGQGTVRQENQTWIFSPEEPLSGFTLVAGPYHKSTLQVDSLNFELYRKADHNYYSTVFTDIADTLPDILRELRNDVERSLAMKYPFSRFRMIEVPIQFYTFSRIWTENRDVIQPEMILLPEMAGVLNRADFAQELKRQAARNKDRDQGLSEKELQINILRNFIIQNFIPAAGVMNFRMIMSRRGGGFSGNIQEHPFSIFPMFLNYRIHLTSVKYPVLNSSLEAYLNNQANSTSNFFRGMSGGISETEKANMALLNRSLHQILIGEKDPGLIKEVIKAKGIHLFTYMESVAGVKQFSRFLENLMQEYRFQSLTMENFIQLYQKEFGVDLTSYLAEWYQTTKLPGFLINGTRVIEMKEGDYTRFQVLFNISNPTDAEGVVLVTIRAGRRGRGNIRQIGFGITGRDINNERLYHLKSREAIQVGIIQDNQPRGLSINTLVSKNIPSNMTFPFPEVEKIRSYKAFEGIRSIPLIKTLASPGEKIVDNEDTGFSLLHTEHRSRLAEWLNVNKNDEELPYQPLQFWRPPLEWTAITSSGLYGEFIHSGYYIRSGDGDRTVQWVTVLPEPGYYEVYAYIDPMLARISNRMRGRGGNR